VEGQEQIVAAGYRQVDDFRKLAPIVVGINGRHDFGFRRHLDNSRLDKSGCFGFIWPPMLA
jgi:hypothetical protein